MPDVGSEDDEDVPLIPRRLRQESEHRLEKPIASPSDGWVTTPPKVPEVGVDLEAGLRKGKERSEVGQSKVDPIAVVGPQGKGEEKGSENGARSQEAPHATSKDTTPPPPVGSAAATTGSASTTSGKFSYHAEDAERDEEDRDPVYLGSCEGFRHFLITREEKHGIRRADVCHDEDGLEGCRCEVTFSGRKTTSELLEYLSMVLIFAFLVVTFVVSSWRSPQRLLMFSHYFLGLCLPALAYLRLGGILVAHCSVRWRFLL